MQFKYPIDGVTCGGCAAKVKAALAPFATSVDVSLNPSVVTIDAASPPDHAQMNAALREVGNYHLRDGQLAELTEVKTKGFFATYRPLLILVGYITFCSLAGASVAGVLSIDFYMMNFMAGFFLVFSAFKFLNLEGFVAAFARYDLLAAKWRDYGYVYPFIELGLGLLYLFRLFPTATLVATLLIMGFSSLGVIDAVRKKKILECACLGTVLKLPVGTVTLIEDIGMTVMAAIMLLMMLSY